jgi:hypothetical protein
MKQYRTLILGTLLAVSVAANGVLMLSLIAEQALNSRLLSHVANDEKHMANWLKHLRTIYAIDCGDGHDCAKVLQGIDDMQALTEQNAEMYQESANNERP